MAANASSPSLTSAVCVCVCVCVEMGEHIHVAAEFPKNNNVKAGLGRLVSPATLTCSVDTGEEMFRHLVTLLLIFVDICPSTDSGRGGEGRGGEGR